MINGKDLQKSKFKNEKKYLIEDILPHKITLLGGQPRVGKTNLTLQMVNAIATKNSMLFGKKSEYSKVLYFSLDTEAQQIQSRLKELKGNMKNVFFEFLDEDDNVETISFEKIRTLTEVYNKERKKGEGLLVVIDMLSNVTYGNRKYDFNKYEDVREMMGNYKTLSRKYSCDVLLLHHLNKSKNNDKHNSFNGSTAFRGTAQSTLILEEDTNTGNIILDIDSRYFNNAPINLKRNKKGFFELDESERLLISDNLDINTLIKFIAKQYNQCIEDTATNIVTRADLKRITNSTLYQNLCKYEELLKQCHVTFSRRKSNGKSLIKIAINEEIEELYEEIESNDEFEC